MMHDILEEFVEAQGKRGYQRPRNLSEIERCPLDDEGYVEEDSHCPVDRFLKKNKGLR